MAIGTLLSEMTVEKKKIVDDFQLTMTVQNCQAETIPKLQSLIDGDISTEQTPPEVKCFKDIISCSDFLLEILAEDLSNPSKKEEKEDKDCKMMWNPEFSFIFVNINIHLTFFFCRLYNVKYFYIKKGEKWREWIWEGF